ncbi:hypoxanthine-DNA glycosylase [Paraburkholderia bannensis]|uniref:Hypoxanthine-DNA glycosylase n=1 Tax=Paraburkholderia bannensis TaxID=765414 RepID=A0A7W9WTY6_9BURK|nr:MULTISPECIES: DNA-deoxyinosine glycosylase [Paraburkholderia]MBB3258813.1 hypoxanthine-DNA glycosylase [Paraburkholderia sp. WP4_3_2]MBB6103827.1 hypoxanthine-DNA glycosylase [Paraburkholderia bannensis]
MSFKRCFPPVVDARTRVLILGSLPGEASLAHQQYYAHKQNKFWHLVGEAIDVDLPALDYEARLLALLDHRVGLWDVVAQARREGSLDGNIRDHAGNDLVALIESLPALKAIAFNGGTAARIGERILGVHARRYRLLNLPSSSPAYASMNFATKLVAWRALADVIDEAEDAPATKRGTP